MINLIANSPKNYGKQHKDHLLEQYKLYVSGIEKISEHRIGANNFFLSLNTGIVALEGLMVGQKYVELKSALILFGVVGIASSLVWWILINSYRQLNTGKFAVLHELEKHLPASLYTTEWKVLGEGKKMSSYFPFSHVESLIPLIYLAANAVLVYWLTRTPAAEKILMCVQGVTP